MLQLLLFDLDDTLFDHQHSRRCGLLALQHVYPLLARIPLETLIAEHERQLNASYDRVLDGTVSMQTNRRERFQRLFIHCGVEMSETEAEQAMACYRRTYEAQRRAVPGVIPLLVYLKTHVRIGVVTNGLVAVQQEKLITCKLDGLVDFLLTSEETGVKKPDPRLFLLALAKGKARREETVVIGDSWSLDILGASRAGIRSIWLNRGQAPCPDASLTTELMALEPLERVLEALDAVGNTVSARRPM
jgi:putative hydrolase of the HAD superfamily